MRRSSKVTVIILAGALTGLLSMSPSGAQVYGFPGEVGVIDDGFGTLPPVPPPLPAGLPPAELPPLVVPPPAPPPCPLVIKVGRGLSHAARTRIVYGRPAPCS